MIIQYLSGNKTSHLKAQPDLRSIAFNVVSLFQQTPIDANMQAWLLAHSYDLNIEEFPSDK
jgi:hypothetical protein